MEIIQLKECVLSIYSILLLFIPGCMFLKRKESSIQPPVYYIDLIEKKSNDTLSKKVDLDINDDIEEFELEDIENPFSQDSGNNKNIKFESEEGNFPANDFYKSRSRSIFQPIYFDFDSKNIREDQISKVDRSLKIIQNFLKQKGDAKIELVIEGHACDSAGTPQYNLILSEDRSKMVAKYLVNHGINKKFIQVVGRGCEMKIVPFGSREQQAPNRRVEIYMYEK